jgi:GWxTD domain-containing protein
MVILVVLTVSCPGDVWSNLVSGSVSYSVSGRRAWTVSREAGTAALTEVWVEAQDGSHVRLGIVPGSLGWMGWSPDGRKVLYRDGPLESKLLSTGPRRSVGMVSASTWEIHADGGGIRRLRDAKPLVRSGLWARSSGNGNSFVNDLSGVLGNLQEALRISSLAYGALHQWDFRLAKGLYRQAAHQFEELTEDFGELGLHDEPVLDYARELARRSTEAGNDGSRWVCREHLNAIGDLLKDYETVHDGQSPEDLAALRDWAVGDEPDGTTVRSLTRLFRSPADPIEGRVSYFYSPFSPIGGAAATSPFYKGHLVELVRTGSGFTVVDREVGQAQIDSLMDVGERLLAGEGGTAVPALEVVTRMAPKFALGFCKLGYAYLKDDNLDMATKAFEKSLLLNHKLAESYNGLGLVYQQLPKARYTAIHYFQKALQHNRTYIEARYNMALLRQALEEHDVIHDVKRILDIDPEFAPAYKLLGEWHEVYEEDFEQAAIHYAHYMSLAPEDPEGQRLLANVYLRAKDFNRIVELLTEYIDEHPEEIPVLSVLAQACVELGRLEWARRYFDDFLAGTNEAEKSYYQDPWALMSKNEVAGYQALGPGEREDFLTKFWLDRDPDLTSATNERQLEHYRRVWFARQNFSKGKSPWDRRGEVYIRFGEPDFRSTSSM